MRPRFSKLHTWQYVNNRFGNLKAEYRDLTGLDYDERNGTAQVPHIAGDSRKDAKYREALAIHGEIRALEQLVDDLELRP